MSDIEAGRLFPLKPPVPRTLARSARRRTGTLAGRVLHRGWPPLLAVAITLLIWEGIYLSGWRPSYVLPDPATVLGRTGELLASGKFWQALGTTMFRAAAGFGLALGIGTLVGLVVSFSRTLRAAVGSMITGLQTMPSIAWFPFAILLFGLSESAILFVVILGAAPSIANGIISGIDDVPRALVRTATVLGARGLSLYRYVIVPAALPAYLSGLKQGWAFAWRSLMAGELLVIIASKPSLGVQLQFHREFADTAGLMSVMIIILLLGMLIDGVLSGVSNGVRARRGMGSTS